MIDENKILIDKNLIIREKYSFIVKKGKKFTQYINIVIKS